MRKYLLANGGATYEIFRDACFYVKIRNKHSTYVVDKIAKRCACWPDKLLGSIPGRITLVQACLTNMLLCMMSFYCIP